MHPYALPMTYAPHDTFRNGSPWDPYYPTGDAPGGDDGTAGGAMFRATIADKQGQRLRVNITLTDDHRGYAFAHVGKWVDDPGIKGKGGLLLEGGGSDSAMLRDPTDKNSLMAISWFLNQAQGGDIVIIANDPTADGAARAATLVNYFYSTLGSRKDTTLPHAVDVFDINVGDDDLLTPSTGTRQDQQGSKAIWRDLAQLENNGLSNELLDKLKGAEAVFFMGGDQWPYVQLLRPAQNDSGSNGPDSNNLPNKAADTINSRNTGDLMTVGGTSAGLAILGSYVFTAHTKDDLVSYDALNEPYGKNLVIPGTQSPAISNTVLKLKFMRDMPIITDTHFAERDRMGRLVTFLAHMDITFGLGQNVKGIGVNERTALSIDNTGNSEVYGAGSAYFVRPDGNSPQNNDFGLDAPLEFAHLQVNRFRADSADFVFATGWNQRPSSYWIDASTIDPRGWNWRYSRVFQVVLNQLDVYGGDMGEDH